MSGFKKFTEAVVQTAQKVWEPRIKANPDQFADALKNHLLDLDGPRQLEYQPDAHEEYVARISRGFMEISTSLERLEDIAFYIRRFPFQGTRITRERYLQFHVEAHYSEIYILQQRLSAYISLFRKQFKKDPKFPNVQQLCETLEQAIDLALKGVVDLRDRHIHVVRFKDEDIDRLSTIELLTQDSDWEFSRLMRNYYAEEHRRVKKLWRDRTASNMKRIRQFVDELFDALFPMVFEPETGKLRNPRGIRTPRIKE